MFQGPKSGRGNGPTVGTVVNGPIVSFCVQDSRTGHGSVRDVGVKGTVRTSKYEVV